VGVSGVKYSGNPSGRRGFTTGKNVIAGVKIGDFEYRRIRNKGETLSPMKSINRLALGTISSLLLSAGLTKAAQKLDPLSNSTGNSFTNDSPAGTCTSPCFYQSE
jgi:hypothetical protein